MVTAFFSRPDSKNQTASKEVESPSKSRRSQPAKYVMQSSRSGVRDDFSSRTRNQPQEWSLSTGKHRTNSQFKTNIKVCGKSKSLVAYPVVKERRARLKPMRGGCGPTPMILNTAREISRVNKGNREIYKEIEANIHKYKFHP